MQSKSVSVTVEAKRKYNRPEVKAFLDNHKQTIEQVLPIMAAEHKARLPKSILLRPVYCKSRLPDYYGMAFYDAGDWQIMLTYEHLSILPDNGLETVLHECAHVIEHVLHQRMQHGQAFHKILSSCKENREKEVAKCTN